MEEEATTTATTRSASRAARIVGWVLGILPCLLLLFSAWMKLSGNKQAVDGFAQMGFPQGVALKIGAVELACTILYLVPQTAVLGAILLTGYLGGATVTHVRVGEPWFAPVIVGVVLWLGLFLRDPRLRALVPFRR
jgi:hypothetical protein